MLRNSGVHSKTGRQHTVSIIIPFYNEEDSIERLHARINPALQSMAARWRLELILVDDGSSDNTYEKLLQTFPGHTHATIVILRHAENRGLGGAMRTGFTAAHGDIVCTTDSDCSYAPEELEQMVEKLSTSDADIITGSPYHPEGAVVNVTPRRLLLSKAASRMYSFLVPTKLYCYTSFFRAYRREWARCDFFRSTGFLAVTEILLNAAREGARIAEYPTTLGVRHAGQSKMKIGRTTLGHLRLMSQTAVASSAIAGFTRYAFARNQPQPYLVPQGANGPKPAHPDNPNLLSQWALLSRTQSSSRRAGISAQPGTQEGRRSKINV